MATRTLGLILALILGIASTAFPQAVPKSFKNSAIQSDTMRIRDSLWSSGVARFTMGITIGRDSTAKISIDGVDGTQTVGGVSIYETGGELDYTSRHNHVFRLDNDANFGNAAFQIWRNGSTGGRPVFTASETTGVGIWSGRGWRGGRAHALELYDSLGMPLLWVFADSNLRGAISNNIFRVGVRGEMATEGSFWVDENVQLGKRQYYDTTSVSVAITAGDTIFHVLNKPATLWGDVVAMIGDLSGTFELVNIRDTIGYAATGRICLERDILHSFPVGTKVYFGRWRGDIFPISTWHTPVGDMRLGAELFAREVPGHVQRVILNSDHVTYSSHPFSVLGPMILYGGTVSATVSASMNVRVDSGLFSWGGSGGIAWTVPFDSQTVSISAADNDSNRIDLITVDQDTSGVVKVIRGALAVSPVPPALPAGKNALAEVAVDAAVTTITSGDITDKRQLSMKLAPMDNVVGIGTDTVLQTAAGASFLSLRGSSTSGRIELSSSQSDATQNSIGVIQASDKWSIAADKRVASIVFNTVGGTATNRGGDIRFNVKADGVSGTLEALRLDTNRAASFGGGNVWINRANTAKIRISGTDGVETSGDAFALIESGGGAEISSASSLIIGLDNNADEATLFAIKSNGLSGATTFQIGEDGDLDMIKSIAYTWPANNGDPGEHLTTNGSGVLTWDSSASAAWGGITGSLSSQTDLADSLNALVHVAGDVMTGPLTGEWAAGTTYTNKAHWLLSNTSTGSDVYATIGLKAEDYSRLEFYQTTGGAGADATVYYDAAAASMGIDDGVDGVDLLFDNTNAIFYDNVYTGNGESQVATVRYNGNLVLDWDRSNTRSATLTNGVNSLGSITNAQDGTQYYLILKQPASGAHGTINWIGATFVYKNDVVPVLHRASGAVDVLRMVYNGLDSKWYVEAMYDSTTPPAASWGSIIGTLSSQTDLQAALDAKVPTSTTLTVAGTANEVESSAGAQDLSANRTWTIGLPDDIDVTTGISVGATAPTQVTAGRNYITIKGSTGIGVLELNTATADAPGNTLGIVQFVDVNSTLANKTRASITGNITTTTTANARGADLRFNVSNDNTSSVLEALRLDTNRAASFGGGNVWVNRDNTAKIRISGTDGAEVSGDPFALYESGGGANISSGSSFILGLDNNSDETTFFAIKSNGTGGTTTFQVGEDGDLDKIKGIAYTWPTDDGDAGEHLQSNGSGTLTWEPSTVAWGGLTGSIASQTDLADSLDALVHVSGDVMTGNLAINGSSSSYANRTRLTIENTGTGAAMYANLDLKAEDFARVDFFEPSDGNPDASWYYDVANDKLTADVNLDGSEIEISNNAIGIMDDLTVEGDVVSGNGFGQIAALRYAGSAAFDWSKSNVRSVTLSNSTNAVTFSNEKDGAVYYMVVKQPASGAHGTIVWPGTPVYKTGSAPVLHRTNGAVDVLRVFYNGLDSKFYVEAMYDSSPAATVAWGAITGTLSAQTDLQSALDAKAPIASPSFTGTVTLPVGLTGTLRAASGVVSATASDTVGLAAALFARALTATTLTINGTSNEIESSVGAQDLSANRTVTLGLPDDIDVTTGISIGATGPTQTTAGRNYLTIKGSTGIGTIELNTATADAAGNTLGLIQFVDINSTLANKTRASITGNITTTVTGNARGGDLRFNVSNDNVSSVSEALRLDTNRSASFGGGNVWVNRDNTAKVRIGGTDGAEVSGDPFALWESGGGGFISSSSDVTIGLDNNTGETASFRIKSDGTGGTELARLTEGGMFAIGAPSTPHSKLHINGASGWIIDDEQDTDPTTTELDANDSVAMYTKNNKLVFAYNNGGTITYVTIALDGSATTIVHSTTAP